MFLESSIVLIGFKQVFEQYHDSQLMFVFNEYVLYMLPHSYRRMAGFMVVLTTHTCVDNTYMCCQHIYVLLT